MSIKVNLSNFTPFYGNRILEEMEDELTQAHNILSNGTGEGSEYTGWVRWPETFDKEELENIKRAADKIRHDSEVFVVIGIGGSYLGAQAGIHFIKSAYYNFIEGANSPQIFFIGNNISGESITEIMEIVGDRDFSVNVISKSGTTTEPAIAFRLFKEKLEDKYGMDGAAKRIYATTDKDRGSLHHIALERGYHMFSVPDSIGGRYSVLSSVGLLPIAVSGVDIDSVLEGASSAMKTMSVMGLSNPAWQYAAARNMAYRQGKVIEILGFYEPKCKFVAEWWKQLFGESEGKDGKGLFPASVQLTTDLHSIGQFIQDGTRSMIETIISIEQPKRDIVLRKYRDDCDRLNYLAGISLDAINKNAQRGAALAHVDGGVPNIEISFRDASARTFGELVYFFEFACGISGYVLGVNPFDQPGVEAYKKNMFALLGKPGYEDMQKELLQRIQEHL